MTRPEVDGRTLADLAGDEAFRSVYLRGIQRAGTPVPIFPETTVQRGDVLTIEGPARRVAVAVSRLGVPDLVTDVTDMVLVALGIVAGALVGIPAIRWAGIEIGLSLSVGVLLGGLVCGWLRSMWPRFFGRIPGPTLWVFESIGLAGFVAVVGLNAGPDFVTGLRTSGVSLLLAGLATATVPHMIGIAIGRWVFKMHPGVLLGVCAGGGTATPALAAIQEAAKSPVPTLGYGVAYAVGNVLLALWGSRHRRLDVKRHERIPVMKNRCLIALALALSLTAAAGPMAAQEKPASEQDANYAKELEIRELLLEKGGEKALAIQVSVDRTKAILIGEVPTRAAQELAEEVARSVEGIKSVDNRLRVGGAGANSGNTMEQETADAYLESKVKRHLYEEIGKRARNLEVEAVDGVVSLRGALPDASRKQLALDAATKTAGVKRVVDLIKIKP